MASSNATLNDPPSPFSLRIAIFGVGNRVLAFSHKFSGDPSDSIYSIPSEFPAVVSSPDPNLFVSESVFIFPMIIFQGRCYFCRIVWLEHEVEISFS